MPVKLIATLLFAVFIALLTGHNLDNKCSIWFFHLFEGIPVFTALLTAFLAGVLVTLPFTFMRRKKPGSKNGADSEKKPRKEKKPLFKKRAKDKTMEVKVDEPDEAASEEVKV